MRAGHAAGARGASSRAGSADAVQVEEALLAETFLRGKDKHSVGGGNTSDANGAGEDGLAVGAVRISITVGLDAVSIGVG